MFPAGATLQALFAHSSAACLVLDLDGRVLDVNEQAEQILQRPRAAMLAHLAWDVLPNARTTRFVGAFHRLLKDGMPMQDETYGPYGGRWISIRAFHVERGVAVVLRDVTKRHHGHALSEQAFPQYHDAAQALPSIEPSAPEMFGHSRDGVVIFDLQASVIAANATFAAMLGYAAATLIGQVLAEMVVSSDRAITMDHFRAVVRGDTVAVIMPTLTTAHGHTVPVQMDSTLVRDAHGAPLYVRSVIRAVGERTHAEYPLQESAVWLHAIMESLAEGLLITDEHDVVLYANKRMIELTGYTPEELLGKPAYTLLLPPNEWPTMQGNNQRRISGVAEQYEMQLVCKDGSRRWTNINAAPLRNSAGEIVATLGAMTDIEEHKRVARRGAAFSALGQQLSSATTAVEAAHIIAHTADELIGWDAYSLLLYNATTNTLQSILDMDLIDNVRQEMCADGATVTPGPLTQRTLAEGPLLLLPPQAQMDLSPAKFGDEDRPSASLMFVPIKRDGHNIGVLTIQSYTPHAYTAADLATLQALADHCSGALERIRAEAALRSAEARYRDMVENASDMIYVHDLRGTILSVNAAVEQLTGYGRDELIGKNAARFVTPASLPLVRAAFNGKTVELQHIKPFEIEILCKNGTHLPVEVSARLVCDDDDTVVALEGIARDVRERKRAEATIRHMAFYDTLTNLPNRVLFDEYLRHALALATQHHTTLAVLFVDLDRFKLINDALGHHTGDLLLEAVPQRLLGCVRPGDTVARMGGDEFTVLLPNITSTDDAALVAQRLLDALTMPFIIGGHELFVSASVGISVFPADGDDAETLLKHADTAMYRAKDGGRSGYQFYTPAMNAATHKQHQLEQRLRRALERDEFFA